MDVQCLEAAHAAARSGPIAAFSFDVFDTFLLRRTTTPDGVFERAFALAPIPAQWRGMAEAFVQQRQLAEGKCRKAASAAGGSPEVTIEEIYQRFPTGVFGLNRDQWPALVEAEFQAELELCFANPDVADLIRELRASGMRTGFISDTYWRGEQLGRLLAHCAPDLGWDFLYASCDHRSGKGEKLFTRYMKEQRLTPATAAHLGDNDLTDILPARKLGITAIRYPQASPALIAQFQRETGIFRMFCADNGASPRLDHGNRTCRRVVTAKAPAQSPAFTFGVRVLGPVLSTFDRFVSDRIAKLQNRGNKVAVAFLARDGLAPLEIWRAQRHDTAGYVEANRRIAMIAGSETMEPVVQLFERVTKLNHDIAVSFFKADTPRLRKYFQHQPNGIVSGKEFAAALPHLIGNDLLHQLADRLRKGLVAHLRAAIPQFDECTDLVLVDLGYSGTVQKALRTVFDKEGLSQRLHGLYLLTADEALHDVAADDSAEGMLSDRIMTPHAKRAMLNNVSILEQLCSAPQGSVRDYDASGNVLRESDPRPPAQLALCDEIRQGAIHFTRHLAAMPAAGYPDPAADLTVASSWAGAVLARALLLPTDDELVLLGGCKHDINLGSQSLAPMADPQAAQAIVGAKPFHVACGPHEPPMWMAGSMAALSPLHGMLYALMGAGQLIGDVAGDVPCGTAEVALLDQTGGQQQVVTCLRTGYGDVRLRVPVIRAAGATTLAVTMSALPRRGFIRSISVQTGETAKKAMQSAQVDTIAVTSVQALGPTLDRGLYEGSEGHLLIPLPPLDQDIAVLTLTITPLDGQRILSLEEDGRNRD